MRLFLIGRRGIEGKNANLPSIHGLVRVKNLRIEGERVCEGRARTPVACGASERKDCDA